MSAHRSKSQRYEKTPNATFHVRPHNTQAGHHTPLYLGNIVHQHVLDSVLKGNRRAGASRTGSSELHRNGSRVRVETLIEDVASVLLYRWPHLLIATPAQRAKHIPAFESTTEFGVRTMSRPSQFNQWPRDTSTEARLHTVGQKYNIRATPDCKPSEEKMKRAGTYTHVGRFCSGRHLAQDSNVRLRYRQTRCRGATPRLNGQRPKYLLTWLRHAHRYSHHRHVERFYRPSK